MPGGKWLLLLVVFASALCAQAAMPVRTVTPGESVNLAREMQTMRLPAGVPLEADGLWAAPAPRIEPAGDVWRLEPGDRWLGRVVVSSPGVESTYVIVAPLPQVDEVRVWTRARGGQWQLAMAGDLVPLSAWPFANAFPAFPLKIGPEPVDVMVSATNSTYLRVPVQLVADERFRETQVLRANFSGIVMGLGAMVAFVCLIGAIAYRGRPRWLLAGLSIWTLLTVTANNGYLAVWLTPELPAFNDAVRHFTGMGLAGFMLLMFTEVLDPMQVARWERIAALTGAVLCFAYGVAQAAWLPFELRVPGAVVCAGGSLLACAYLGGVNALRGGRYAGYAVAAVACLLLVPLIPALGPDPSDRADLRAGGVAISLFSALMLLRQALMLRDRYGRDVLSRAAISGDRDPLTALWSFEGFQQRYSEALLREQAGPGLTTVMLMSLPGLERSTQDHGAVLTERALVRLAAALQGLLGPGWAIGRVSNSRFAAISLRPLTALQLSQVGTQVVSHCSRITQPLNLVGEFDLRIACAQEKLVEVPLADLLRRLNQAALLLSGGKRIAYIA